MLEDEDSQKGISKLEKWLKKTDCKGYEIHIRFLRDLQELRSTGTGHRKGKKSDNFMRLLYEIATEKMM